MVDLEMRSINSDAAAYEDLDRTPPTLQRGIKVQEYNRACRLVRSLLNDQLIIELQHTARGNRKSKIKNQQTLPTIAIPRRLELEESTNGAYLAA